MEVKFCLWASGLPYAYAGAHCNGVAYIPSLIRNNLTTLSGDNTSDHDIQKKITRGQNRDLRLIFQALFQYWKADYLPL